MNKKGNKGYQVTHQKICSLVLDKMENVPLHEITIQSVCKELEINRSTFYAHFQDIYAVAETIQEEYNSQLIQSFRTLAESGAPLPQDYFLTILRHVREHKAFYMNALTDDFSLMVEKDILELRKTVAEPMMRLYNVKENHIPYYFTYVQHGFFAIIEMWLKGDCRETPEEICRIVFDLNPDMEKYWKPGREKK